MYMKQLWWHFWENIFFYQSINKIEESLEKIYFFIKVSTNKNEESSEKTVKKSKCSSGTLFGLWFQHSQPWGRVKKTGFCSVSQIFYFIQKWSSINICDAYHLVIILGNINSKDKDGDTKFHYIYIHIII